MIVFIITIVLVLSVVEFILKKEVIIALNEETEQYLQTENRNIMFA